MAGMIRRCSHSVAGARETEGVNCEAPNGGRSDVQRPFMPLLVGGLNPNITMQKLWEEVQQLTRQNKEIEQNMQAMQATQI